MSKTDESAIGFIQHLSALDSVFGQIGAASRTLGLFLG
jgi:hypothetical protein